MVLWENKIKDVLYVIIIPDLYCYALSLFMLKHTKPGSEFLSINILWPPRLSQYISIPNE